MTRRLFIERSETPDKSYSGDNRLVLPERPQRRQRSAPRCRLALARGWRSSQAFGCSPIKKARELGSDRGAIFWLLARDAAPSESHRNCLVFSFEIPRSRRHHAVMRGEKPTYIGGTLMHENARAIPREPKKCKNEKSKIKM